MTTIGQRIYLEQKARDANNPGCIEYHREMQIGEKFRPKKTAAQKKLIEEGNRKYEEQLMLGYESKRYNFPEYQWKFQQDGKSYLRSSCNNNVYDNCRTSLVVGTWNQVLQRIELNDDLIQRIQLLEETVFNLRKRLEELHSE